MRERFPTSPHRAIADNKLTTDPQVSAFCHELVMEWFGSNPKPYRQVQMTMINFKRTGGMMGRELSRDFDLNNLPASEAQRLHNMLNESKFFEVPVVHDLRTGPDEYEYVITVVAGNSIHTVHVSETSMPPSLRPLIEDLTEIAKTAT